MSSLALDTGPAIEPVTLAEAKEHLRVTHDDDNDYITDLITMARQWLDGPTGVLGRALITQTWTLTMPSFPDGDFELMPELQSISSITYLDTDGASQTLAATVYEADTGESMVRLKYNQTFPATRNIWNAVVVTFVTGYGAAASNLPNGLIHAIKILIGDYYGTRQSILHGVNVSKVPEVVWLLIAPYRVSWL